MIDPAGDPNSHEGHIAVPLTTLPFLSSNGNVGKLNVVVSLPGPARESSWGKKLAIDRAINFCAIADQPALKRLSHIRVPVVQDLT
ncbi:hypothetical protein MTX20_00105 (plasmid) [Bradyrhizobium sp. ISRA435]|nr:hypothetical protein MTX20_00105 [Bradyrhizobium sp. ISRA435]